MKSMKNLTTKVSTGKPLSEQRPNSAVLTKSSRSSLTSINKPSSIHSNPTIQIKITHKRKLNLTQKRFTSCILTHIINKPLLVTAGDCQISLWDLNSFKIIKTLQIPNFEINHICYLEHTGLILGSSWKNKELRLWSVINKDLKFHSRKPLNYGTSCSVQLTKIDIVCTASLTRDLLFWGSRSGKNYSRFKIPQGLEIRVIAAVEDKNCIAVGCKDGSVLLVNYRKKQVVQTFTLSFKIIIIMDLFPPFMAYNSASGHLFIGSCNSNIEVLKISSQPEVTMKPISHSIKQQGIRCLYCFEKEKIFVTAHDDPFLRVWNAQKLELIDTAPAKISQAYCLSIDSKTKSIAVANFQSTSFSLLNY